MRRKVVIIGHGYTSRLAVIRSVAQADCDIIVIVMAWHKRFSKKIDKKKPIDCYSKYVSRFLFCYAKDEEGLVQLLLNECVDPHQKVVIIPDSDVSAAVIDKNQKRLENHFLFPHIHHTPGDIVEWMDKVKQKALAHEIGLNVASSNVIRIKERKYQLPSTITYPCFTKPLTTIVGGKHILKRCDNEIELIKVLDYAASIGDMQVLVEDYKKIETEYALVGFSDGNEVVIPGVIEIINMSHGGHFGVACKGRVLMTTAFDDIVPKFKELLIKIGYIGLFDIDFFKSDNKLFFDELNLRFGGSGYVITKLGVNLPVMFVKSICGKSFADMPKSLTSTATFVNERMCMDDWYARYINTNDFFNILQSADISFIGDEEDPIPQKIFICEYRKKRIMRFLKKYLR